jgi:tetratricopeptide (TPR) repeat protein/calcineurin-like phosphoesterase family protein
VTKQRLRILHLSDLHMGQECGAGRWRVRDVLGDAWRDNLDAIVQDRPIDLVCFTGDLAFSGKPGEYREAGEAIEFLLQRLKLDKSRFFCVPGNHDIDRDVEEDAWRQLRDANDVRSEDFDPWIAGGRAPRACDDRWRDAVLLRRRAYDCWLTEFGLDRLRPEHHRHGRLGYRVTFAPGELGNAAPLHIIGFDSAWLAGDGDEREQDNANLRITREQVGRLMSDDNGDRLTGYAIGLIHHPFSNLIEIESQSMPGLMSRQGLGLLLHGHLHDLRLTDWASPRHGLHISSAGSQYQRNDVPNTIHLLDLDLSSATPLRPVEIWVRAWSREGFWHDDNSRYAGMQNGRLRLVPEVAVPFNVTPGQFIGRDDERNTLCAALLPAARGEDTRPTVICCAIAGMPGVGKTRLAEEFIAKEWREALGLSLGTPQAELCARLALAPDDSRSAQDLAAAVLSAYGRNATPDRVFDELRMLLQSGPGCRRLLLIENVDSSQHASMVAALVAQLPGCAVLATARYRDLGDHWRQVPVQPLPRDQAIALLRNRMALGRKPHPLSDDEAVVLVERLGRLPLALHIAGSHLGRGVSPQSFEKALEEKQLALGPAGAVGDATSDSDAARSVIASAFSISLEQWCRSVDPAWQAALVALAHGPTEGVGDALGTAMTELVPSDYEACTLDADGLSLLEVEFIDHEGASQRRVRMHPLIAEFLRLQPGSDEATVMARIGAWCDPLLRERDAEVMPAAWATLRAETPALLHWLARAPKPPSVAAVGIGTALYALSNGPYADWLRACVRWADGCEESVLSGTLRLAESRFSYRAGDPLRSEHSARLALAAFQQAGDERSRAITQGQIADILQARGELEQALHIRREEVLPAFKRLGDPSLCAVEMGRIADILQARGELDEALRIRCEEELPVYDRLGDVRERAITQGKIANILEARGELDEALRIRREEQMPVYERLGDVHSLAITQGQIADILQARGELEEALRIRREEQIPVYERLGDVRSLAITQGQIADILQARGELEEALRIRREEELPVYERQGDVRSLLVGRANLAIALAQRGLPEDGEEIFVLMQQALADAERLHLPEADSIRGWIARIFGPGDEAAALP